GLNSLVDSRYEEYRVFGFEGTVTTVADTVEASERLSSPLAVDMPVSSSQTIRDQLRQTSELAEPAGFFEGAGTPVEPDTCDSEPEESLPMLPYTRASSVATTRSSIVVTTMQQPPRGGHRQVAR